MVMECWACGRHAVALEPPCPLCGTTYTQSMTALNQSDSTHGVGALASHSPLWDRFGPPPGDEDGEACRAE